MGEMYRRNRILTANDARCSVAARPEHRDPFPAADALWIGCRLLGARSRSSAVPHCVVGPSAPTCSSMRGWRTLPSICSRCGCLLHDSSRSGVPGGFVQFYLWCGLGGAVAHLLRAPHRCHRWRRARSARVLVARALRWPDEEVYIFGVIPMKSALAGGGACWR